MNRRATFVLVVSALFALFFMRGASNAVDKEQIESEPGFRFTFNFSSEQFRVRDLGDGSHAISLRDVAGVEYLEDESEWGRPNLPRVASRAVLREFDDVRRIRVLFADPDTLPGNYYIRPIQPPAGSGFDPVGPDPDVYGSFVPYPLDLAEPVSAGSARGVRLLNFRINPVQYIGIRQQLIVYRTVQVQLEVSPLDGLAASNIRKRQRPGHRWSKQQREVDWVKRTIINPEDFNDFYLTASSSNAWEDTDLNAFNPTDMPSTDRSPVELVVITNNTTTLGTSATGMEDAFDRIAEWKTRAGVPTVVKTVDWIRDNYNGVDTQERIRNFIIDAYEKWSTDYILIGGDSDVVPARRIIYAGDPNPPADIYYAGLDGDMNFDGDRWFGESNFEVGQNDPFHDVWIGRVPADDPAQAEAFVDKLFQYTFVPGQADSLPSDAFYSKALLATGFVEEVAWPEDRNGFYTSETIAREKLLEDMEISRIYQKVDTMCVDTTSPCNLGDTTDNVFRQPWFDGITDWTSTAQIVDALNEGQAYVWHREHSNTYTLGGPTVVDSIQCGDCVTPVAAEFLTQGAALELDNQGRSFVIVTSGSESNAFDFGSIAESVLMHPAGGAIAYFGKSRSKHGRSHYVAVDFFDELFQNEVNVFGQASAFAQDNRTDFRAVATWNAMGDPTMPLWVGAPDSVNVTISPSSFDKGGVWSFGVTVEKVADSKGVEGALVCIKSNDVYASDYTTSDGTQLFTLNLTSLDTLDVVVSLGNTYPVETTIPYVNSFAPNEALIQYQRHDAFDWLESNANLVAEAGEEIGITVEVKNTGNLNATVDGEAAAYGPVFFNLDLDPATVYIGEDDAHPAADADSGFAFPSNWFGIRPEGVPDELTSGSAHGVFVWRDFDDPAQPLWHMVVRGRSTGSKDVEVTGVITTSGGFDNVDLVDEEAGDSVTENGSTLEVVLVATVGDTDTLTFEALATDWITWDDQNLDLGSVATGATASDDIYFHVDHTVEDGYQLNLTTFFTKSSGTVDIGLSEFTIPIAAPALDWEEFTWGGAFAPGSYEIVPYVRNTGTGRADNVKAFLRKTVGTATVTDSIIVFGPIEAGARGYKGASDKFVFSSTSPSTTEFQVTMRNYYANGDSLDWIETDIDLEPTPRPPSLELEAGAESIRVLWGHPFAILDVRGAYVYRGTEADTTTLARLTDRVVEHTRIYEDRTASVDTTYFYAVKLVDDSGNLSYYSDVRSEKPRNTQHAGWPRRTDGGHFGSPTIADVDGDEDLEVLLGGSDGLYVWQPNGDEFPVGDSDALPFIALTDSIPFSRGLVGAPAVGDIDDDGKTEIVFTRWEDSLFVYNSDDRTLKWKKYIPSGHTGSQVGPGWSSPVIGDIKDNGEDKLEVVVGSLDGALYAWDSSGNEVISDASTADGYFAGTYAGFLYSTPALADLDGDSELEVVVGAPFLFRSDNKGRIMAFDAVDSNGDGEADSLWVWPGAENRAYSTPALGVFDDTLRVVCSSRDEIVVLNALRGNQRTDLSKVVSPARIPIDGPVAPPALGDLTGDGELEVVVGKLFNELGNQNPARRKIEVLVWDAFEGMLHTLSDSLPASPMEENHVACGAVLGDLDGDGDGEIAFGSDAFGLFMWEWNDSVFVAEKGWPIALHGEIQGHLAVGDVDTSDTHLQLVVADRSGRVHMYDIDTGAGTPSIEWSQLGNGPMHQGRHSSADSFTGPSAPVSVSLSHGVPNPFNPNVRFTFSVPTRQHAKVAIYDVLGRHVRTLVNSAVDRGTHSLVWDGTSDHGARQSSGIYFVRLKSRGEIQSRKIMLLR